MPMDVHNVRLRFLAKYGSCNKKDIPILVLKFLEEYQDCDWDDIPIIISDYMEQEVCNCPYVVCNDETDDDEEEYEDHYYHHGVSQAVLQESSLFENEPMENSAESECLNSDFVVSMEEEVLESCVMPDLEAENSAATTFGFVVKEHNVSCQKSNDIDAHNDIIKELQEMLEIDDEKLEELVQRGFREEQILNAEFDKFYQANGEQAHAENFGGYNSTIMESQSGLISHCLPCKCEFVLSIEPKPLIEFLKEFDFNGGLVNSNIGYEQMNKFYCLTSLGKTSECVFIHYFEEPPDCFSSVKNSLILKVALTRFQIESWEEWLAHTLLTSFSLRTICKNDKPKEKALKNEYDWKCEKTRSSHLVKIMWELEPD